AGPAAAADPGRSNAPPTEVLLLDSLGNAVPAPTNALPPGLLPPERIGLRHQIPNPLPGAKSPIEIQQRRDAAQEGLAAFEWFPAAQPRLGSYLAGLDEYGNTALRPGPLFFFTPLEQLVQQPKYWLSEYGLRYKLEQSITYLTMTDVAKGDN